MNTSEVTESRTLKLKDVIEYLPNGIISKTVLGSNTGNIRVISLDVGEGFAEKVTPFDFLAHIIEGKAEVFISDHSYLLDTGDAIILPAHTPNSFRANERFKMILTMLKFGYE